MCNFCARELNPELIARLKGELPVQVTSTDDTKTPGIVALVSADAGNAGGNAQLNVEVIPFRPVEDAPASNTLVSGDAFVFTTSGAEAGNGGIPSGMERALSNLTEQENPSMSLQTSDTPETIFWTYSTVASFDDWHF